MSRTIPALAVVLGIAGLVPFAAAGLGALALADDGAGRCTLALIAYGAVILAFLGGVHWGFGLDPSGAPPVRVQRARFGLGVMPSLIGWAALCVAILGWAKSALLVLLAGFVLTTVTEARGATAGWVPLGYMGLRWVLSACVVIVLVSVDLVLAFGGKVVLWR